MQDKQPAAPSPSATSEWPIALLLMVLGLVLAVIPHLVRWKTTGDAVWICDTDELVPYGHLVSHAYREHPWKLGDPALESGGSSMYPWIQFAPWMMLARLFDLGAPWVFGVMRVFAGLTLGLGVYLLARRPGAIWLTAVLAVLAVADDGLQSGLPLVSHWDAVFQIIGGTPGGKLNAWAGPLGQFRLITPGLSFLSMAVALHGLMLLREAPSRRRMIFAGLGFGYCVATYLYFWTAVGGAIGLLLFIDRRNWRWYAGVIAIGLVVGSPALLQNFLTKATYGDDWLIRSEYMVRLTRPFHAVPVKVIALYAVLGIWIWKYNQRLTPVWLTGVVAILLSQSHEVTHIYLQPAHWLKASGMLGCILMLHAALDAWKRLAGDHRWANVLLGIVAIAQVGGAFVIRGWATDHNRETAKIEANRQSWLRFLKANPSLQLKPNSVVAGDTSVTDWAVLYNDVRPLTGAVGLSPSVNKAQWLRRRTLNAWLKGLPEDQVVQSADGEYGVWFNLNFLPPAEREEELAQFRTTCREYAQDATPDLDRTGVRYLVLASGANPPTAVRQTWRQLETKGEWQVWER